jgi:Tol biopolymer transport system component
MTLAAGTKLGPYEIVAPIGAGGMGEVYRARDPRIGRDVAVKVLPTAFSKDPERLRRFEQEARSAGVLNHPNILAIYDVGTHEGAPYVISELLDGETLRERVKAGALPPRKAIEIGTQIAQGLAAAHEHGIVHRDLKPENVFATKDGRVKILDFGLAKLTTPDREGAARPTAPTLLADTGPGAVWGTVGYMSPEQVRGNPVDHRSDIFAFGAILYEMLTGRRPFQGATSADTMSAILKDDPPDLTGIGTIPPALDRLVHHCLEKNPGERFQSARDLAFNLDAISGLSGTKPVPALGEKRAIPGWLPAAAVGLLILAGLVLVLPRALGPHGARPVMRLPIDLPPGSGLGVTNGPAISPNGRMVAFSVVDTSGVTSLWLRHLDSLAPQRLPGTTGAFDPFWSPDCRSIGFFADGKLKRLSVAGGPVQELCNAGSPRGGTWSKDDVIVFAPGASGGLYRVDAAGGNPIPVTSPDSSRGETAHRYPCFLPDGKHFLFLTIPERNGLNDVFAGSVGSNKRKLVLRATRAPQYAAPGFLLFSRGDLLMAQRIDPGRIETHGDAVTIAEAPNTTNFVGSPTASTSNTGAVAYRREAVGNTELGWYNRRGELISRIPAPPGRFFAPQVSPDGSQVVVGAGDPSNTDLWLIDLRRGSSTRLTSDPAEEGGPQWSLDGTRILYGSDRLGGSAFFVKSIRGGADELLYRSPKSWNSVWDWSRDGRYVVFREIDTMTGFDLWILPTFGERKPFPYLNTRFEEAFAAIAPNGHWIAYASNESGRSEIYAQAFPKPGDRYQISVDGAIAPVWSRDGTELFYATQSGSRIMSVAIRADASSIDVGVPRTLIAWPAEKFARFRGMDTAPDGRFVMAFESSEGTSRIPALILNWPELMKRK